jgi:hypothetical protein
MLPQAPPECNRNPSLLVLLSRRPAPPRARHVALARCGAARPGHGHGNRGERLTRSGYANGTALAKPHSANAGLCKPRLQFHRCRTEPPPPGRGSHDGNYEPKERDEAESRHGVVALHPPHLLLLSPSLRAHSRSSVRATPQSNACRSVGHRPHALCTVTNPCASTPDAAVGVGPLADA